MGVENNEAVLFTTWDETAITKIKKWISESVSDELKELFVFVPSVVNCKITVMLAPDGSKKGWALSNEVTQLRKEFIIQLRDLYGDWVEVGYGEYGQTILRGNCCNRYDDQKYYGH